ncbi:FAD-binding oxidoreductase [Sphingomonas qomolangmaensis]|uniref:FAD-binding oxidoreductase n=1 Tax=Sphingomonas qomolangmaensis TaxID=2918765 RepID=A0ABY5L7Y1_9SPHN|nr:FAD-binding oxidoreductase [Sphingomonas qomolangmaensis]UUL82163.1 FAD-binding oxidoreductase [Sphingomonas qomolangmaensis]
MIRLRSGKEFGAEPGQSILNAALSQSLALEYSCRNGNCGVCKTSIIVGESELLRPEIALSADDVAAGFGLTCCRTATSDMAIGSDDLARISHLAIRTLPARISSIDLLAPDVVRVLLRLPPRTDFAYVAGQFIDVIWNGVRRSYSLASAPREDGLLELHIRAFANGVLSGYWFSQAKPNDLLRIEGPLGTFYRRDDAAERLIFLATGTGLAPVKALIEDLVASADSMPPSVEVYWGNRTAQDFYWEPVDLPTGVAFTRVLSGADPDWVGARGHVQNVLAAGGPDLSSATVYACGSQAMILGAQAVLRDYGLQDHNFHYDAFVESGDLDQS